MEIKVVKPRKALNKAFLKVKPNRTEIEAFKTNLIQLLDRTNDTESEEFHKNLVSDFLKKTYYEPNHFINTKGRNDLVIHNSNNAKSAVGVIIEAKKPTNKAEMISTKKLNVKAFQELVLYYLRERITHKNLEVKYPNLGVVSELRPIAAANETITFTLRHARVDWWATVSVEGDINIEFKMDDTLDLLPGNFDGIAGIMYNFFATILGSFYHGGVMKGNENMQTRASWTSYRNLRSKK